MGHHLVLGQLDDYVTGEVIPDTHDERLRQRIAHLLLDERGYQRSDIAVRRPLEVQSGRHRASCLVDFAVTVGEGVQLLIRYAPGALVARERPTVALARLLEPYTIPWAVITNGVDARVLAAATGEVVGTGLEAIFDRDELVRRATEHPPEVLDTARREAEARILLAFDVLECGCGGKIEAACAGRGRPVD